MDHEKVRSDHRLTIGFDRFWYGGGGYTTVESGALWHKYGVTVKEEYILRCNYVQFVNIVPKLTPSPNIFNN